jgi:hypothetical protein
MVKGMMRGRILTLVYALASSLLLPATAGAQSAFAGVVKDATGGVLPGVTVEASSPALIEGVRSASTDANGDTKEQALPRDVLDAVPTRTRFNRSVSSSSASH